MFCLYFLLLFLPISQTELCSLRPFVLLISHHFVHLTLPDNWAIYRLCLAVQRKYAKNENRSRQNDTRVLAAYFRSVNLTRYQPWVVLPEKTVARNVNIFWNERKHVVAEEFECLRNRQKRDLKRKNLSKERLIEQVSRGTRNYHA